MGVSDSTDLAETSQTPPVDSENPEQSSDATNEPENETQQEAAGGNGSDAPSITSSLDTTQTQPESTSRIYPQRTHNQPNWYHDQYC